MHPEIQKVANEFVFLDNRFGGKVIESFYDEENFGNVVITYRFGEVLVDTIRDRDQIHVVFRHTAAPDFEISLVTLLVELGLNGRNPPEAFYGANGSQLMSESLERNFHRLVESFQQRRLKSGTK